MTPERMDTKTILEWAERHLMTTYARAPLCLVRGDGVRVWDADGKEYLDFVGGIAVDALGHCHPKVVAALREQAGTLLHVSNLFHIAPQAQLARLLVEHSFADRVFFSNSGAEANEAAIKLARKYAKEAFASDRTEIITMRGGFHGRTLATLTATAQEKYQRGFEPLVPGFKYVPYGNLRAVEQAVDSRTAAILVEPIQGEGGVVVPDDGYLPGLRRLCDGTGVLLMLDEIQTGVGRTGRLWAHQHWGVEPDVMTLAKALAGGLPIGATLAKEFCARAFTPGSHASTFGGNPLVTRVALAALETVIAERLPERAARMGDYLLAHLRELAARFPAVRAVRGMGLLVALELDRPAGPLVAACREQGLLVLTAGEQVLRMTPPLIVDEAAVDRAAEVLEGVLGREAA